MQRLFHDLFSPFAFGRSSTLVVPQGYGGGRAYIDYFLRYVDHYSKVCKLPVSNKTHKYIYADPLFCKEKTSEAYEKMLSEKIISLAQAVNLCSAHNDYLPDLIPIVWEIIREHELVIVLPGLGFLPWVDEHTWSKIKLLHVYPERVHFLFVKYEKSTSEGEEHFGLLEKLMDDQVTKVGVLSPKDITYSINRWAYILETAFTEKEKKEIMTMSKGRPALIKELCFKKYKRRKITRGVDMSSNEIFPSNVLGKEKKDICSECNVFLSLEETEALTYLKTHKRVCFRSELFEHIWGIRARNLTDGSLTQLIHRLNSKLEKSSGGKITSVYRKGYIFNKKH